MVLLVERYSGPNPVALAVFGLLAVFSFNRVVRLSNGVFVSAIPMVAIASVVAFVSHDAPVGALAFGALCVKLGTLRAGGWCWIGLNAGQIGFSSLAAALVYAPLARVFPPSLPGALLVVIPIAVVYIVVSWSILLLSYAIELRRLPIDVLRDLLP